MSDPHAPTREMVQSQIAAIAYPNDPDSDYPVVYREDASVFDQADIIERLDCLTLCVMVMLNGFVIVGKSVCARTEDFNADVGKQAAYEDALRQAWNHEAYAYRDGLQRIKEERKSRIPANEMQKFIDEKVAQ